MRVIVPSLFPFKEFRGQLDISGSADLGDYILIAQAYNAKNNRYPPENLSWPIHSKQLPLPHQRIPALDNQNGTVPLKISSKAKVERLELIVIDWRNDKHTDPSYLAVTELFWEISDPDRPLYATGRIDGSEWT